MSMQSRWGKYCAGENLYATEDDWNNFVMKVYASWRGQKMQEDSKKPLTQSSEILKYAQEHYGYEVFVAVSEEYKDLADLESKRSDT